MNCPDCGSENIVKDGRRKTVTGEISQKIYCKNCRNYKTIHLPPENTKDIEDAPLRSSIEHLADGTMVINKLIQMTEEDSKIPERVLELAGLSAERWKVKQIKVNAWNTQRPEDKGQLIAHQTTIIAMPKTPLDISIDDIRVYIEEKLPQVKLDRVLPEYSLTGNMLETCIADLHVGRRSLTNDLTPEEKMQETIDNILMRAKGRGLSCVYYVPLGDIVDADTIQATTAKGTQQFLTMTPRSMLKTACDIAIESVGRLLDIAPVRYVYVRGNHDEILSYAIALTVAAQFHADNNFTVDLGEEPHKWDTFGANLIGWTHGDLSKSNIFSWLPVKAREVWSSIKFAEIHSGHINPQKVFEGTGQVVRYLPSPSDASLWEEGMGFGGNVRSSASFIWDPSKGLQEQWFSNI